MTTIENINPFLQETEYCDFNHEEIQKLAHNLTKNIESDQEKAVVLFYWVRDTILYRLGLWQRKASETLAEKSGTCTNKANLLVALLRAINIPAGYGVMKVDGQKYFGSLADPALTKFVGKVSTHIYAAIYLNNKWIQCDPSIDKELCQNTSYFNSTTKLIDWNGMENATIDFNKEHIFENEYPINNIDPYMKKKSKNGRGIPLKVANIYIKFARGNKKIVNNPEEFRSLFEKYFRKKYPIYFYSFCIASLWKDLQLKVKNKS